MSVKIPFFVLNINPLSEEESYESWRTLDLSDGKADRRLIGNVK